MKQLTMQQRYALETYLQTGMGKDLIASKLGVHRSTVYREIRRNKFPTEDVYDAVYACRLSEERRASHRPPRKFIPEVEERAHRLLVEFDCSPEQISGRCRLMGEKMVSHERLYQWIWDDKKRGGHLYLHLRRQGKKSRKRGTLKKSRIPDRRDISERPGIVEKRSRWGDFEIDTVIGKGQKGAIVTINERVTGRLWTKKLLTKESRYVTAAAVMMLEEYIGQMHTMTSDNGSEFAGHKDIAEELGIDFYFARPYHSWERGANENLNGLLRQYIPKWMPLEKVSYYYLEKVTYKLNNRPRKRLGFLTPLEAEELRNTKQWKYILKC